MRAILSVLMGWGLAASAAWGFDVTGLSTPESLIVDPASGNYYIANINGSPTDKDNNGFITRLDKTGRVMAMRFVEGAPLHAPKGMAIVGQTLYVSDIDTVRGFDKTTGNLTALIPLAALGALFLNDLTADDQGNLYVSDSAGFVNPAAPGAVFKIETKQGHRAAVFARDAALGIPNGLMIHPKTKRLLVNTWGTGKIIEISSEGAPSLWMAHDAWQDLDGFDYDTTGNFYISSFTGGKIFRITPDRKSVLIARDLITPADVNIDRKNNLLLVPSFKSHTATTLPILP